MARFSYFVVPVGNVPSTGSALTGRRSPSPAMRAAVTRRTNSRGSSMAGLTIGTACAEGPSGTWTRRSSERSMAAKLRSTSASPRLA